MSLGGAITTKITQGESDGAWPHTPVHSGHSRFHQQQRYTVSLKKIMKTTKPLRCLLAMGEASKHVISKQYEKCSKYTARGRNKFFPRVLKTLQRVWMTFMQLRRKGVGVHQKKQWREGHSGGCGQSRWEGRRLCLLIPTGCVMFPCLTSVLVKLSYCLFTPMEPYTPQPYTETPISSFLKFLSPRVLLPPKEVWDKRLWSAGTQAANTGRQTRASATRR